MTASPPPPVATFLLERLTSGPSRHALIGDLIERYHAGRSRGWYWRQVLAAIVTNNARALWSQKLATIAVVAHGWAMWYVISPHLFTLGSILAIPFGREVNNYLLEAEHHAFRWAFYYFRLWDLPVLMLLALTYAASAWVIGRVRRMHQVPLVLAFALSTAAIFGRFFLFAPYTLVWHSRLVRQDFVNLCLLAVIALGSIFLAGFASRADHTAHTKNVS
jgi:hypothetical protein